MVSGKPAIKLNVGPTGNMGDATVFGLSANVRSALYIPSRKTTKARGAAGQVHPSSVWASIGPDHGPRAETKFTC
jgi:hypothetical protein